MFIIGCSSSTTNTGNRIRRDPFLIVRSEVVASNVANAFDLISAARNNWLRGSITRSINFETTFYPVVYVNTIRYGGISSLKNIPIVNLYEIEFIRPTDAFSRFGADHSGGAILITIIN